MDARSRSSSASRAESAAALFDPGARQGAVPRLGDQACCCVASAVVRIVMPPTPTRPQETELLLCGHHYRVSCQALVAAHARAEELAASLGDQTTWFHGDRRP